MPSHRLKPQSARSNLPIETMAATLAASDRDLADDAVCIQVLKDAWFSCLDILAGLESAQNRARELLVEAA
jgi:hypothetical protein